MTIDPNDLRSWQRDQEAIFILERSPIGGIQNRLTVYVQHRTPCTEAETAEAVALAERLQRVLQALDDPQLEAFARQHEISALRDQPVPTYGDPHLLAAAHNADAARAWLLGVLLGPNGGGQGTKGNGNAG